MDYEFEYRTPKTNAERLYENYSLSQGVLEKIGPRIEYSKPVLRPQLFMKIVVQLIR